MSNLSPHEEWINEVFIEIRRMWVLVDYRLFCHWDYPNVHRNYRYVSFEEEQKLKQHGSAYERVLQQAAMFMKKEAVFLKYNRLLYEEVTKLRQEIKFLKEM